MAVTPRTRPPLLDQRRPPRRPELQQRINVQPPAPTPVAAGAGFPFWMLPLALLMASAIFVTTHFLDHNRPINGDDYRPSPWGPNPEGRLGDGFGIHSIAPTSAMVVHNMPKFGEEPETDRMIDMDISTLYGEKHELVDPAAREYIEEHCVLHGDVPNDSTSCKPVSKLVPNIKYPNVAVEYINKSYNSNEDSTTFTYNVCSLDDTLSISHITFPYLGNCCVLRTNYFGSTFVGGVDSMTCTYGLSMDTGFDSLPKDDRQACKIYTLTYMGNVPASKMNKDQSQKNSNIVSIGLGRDLFLKQRVVGPDCRPPFGITVPPEAYTEYMDSQGVGAPVGVTGLDGEGMLDGTLEPLAVEGGMIGEIPMPAGPSSNAIDQGRETPDFDFENMFGTNSLEPVIPEEVEIATEVIPTAPTEVVPTAPTEVIPTAPTEVVPMTPPEVLPIIPPEVIPTTPTTVRPTIPYTPAPAEPIESGREYTTPVTGTGWTPPAAGKTNFQAAPQTNFQATKPFPWQAPAPASGNSVPGTTGGWTAPVQGRVTGNKAPGPGGGGSNHYVGDGHGHPQVHTGHYTNNGNTGVGSKNPAPGYAFTTGYSSAVNVQSQNFAMTKTALYSEATEDCTPHGDIGYRSKSGQDEALKEIYYSNPYKCGGVVVEINVGNGHTFSSSYYFEYAMGWKSILIEPNPTTFQKLETNRPSAVTWNAAFCSNTEKSLTFKEGDGTEGHGLFYSSKGEDDVASVPVSQGQAPDGGTDVRCIDDLSQEISSKTGHQHVDIMYVSNRGGGEHGTGDAYAALNAVNFETLSLSILVLEVDSSTSFYYSAITSLLTSNGYVKAEWDIRRWCPPVFGSCAQNEVWLEKAFNPLPVVGDPAQIATSEGGPARRRLQEMFDSRPRLQAERLYGSLQEGHGELEGTQEQDVHKTTTTKARHLRQTNHR
jgi:hypothetical protein